MTEELKKEEIKECFCKTKGFRKFLIVALGTFAGVYLALCLFFATHRPPVPPSHFGYGAPAPIVMPCPCHHRNHHFDAGIKRDKTDFHKQKEHAPFDKNRNDNDD